MPPPAKRLRDIGRHYASGHQKRQRTKQNEAELNKIKGSFEKYLKCPQQQVVVNNDGDDVSLPEEKEQSTDLTASAAAIAAPETEPFPESEPQHATASDSVTVPPHHEPVPAPDLTAAAAAIVAPETEPLPESEPQHATASDSVPPHHKPVPAPEDPYENFSGTFDIEQVKDPGCWPNSITSKLRVFLVSKGPHREAHYDFPRDTSGRKFSKSFFSRKMENGQVSDRQWLVYSVSKNRIYCFCCKLFGNSNNALGSDGFCDWINTGARVAEHERSQGHMKATLQWMELEQRLNKCFTIDRVNQETIKFEKMQWMNVFQRLLAIVQYLSEHNMAFRGSSDNLYKPDNGNFLGLVELFAKFDPVMQEHVRRIVNSEIHDHYLGKQIQNELISVMGNKVRKTIVERVKSAKYFSVILDCTPDLSHKEQMSLTVRYVSDGLNLNGSTGVSCGIYEHFITFMEVKETTGEYLLQVMLNELDKLGLQVTDIRGQGYDNGANMKGHINGLQARLLQINSRAFFTPCACHNYNLLLGDMAKTCPEAISFFGVIQRLYVFFSASTHRWSVFCKYVKELSVKPLSETRWECRVQSVKAVRYQTVQIYDALVEIAEMAKDPQARSEAESLCHELRSFKFIVAIIFWYDILFQVNYVSKELQSDTKHLASAIESLKRTCEWMKEYRKSGFESALTDAKIIADDLEIEPVFQATRVRRKKTMFDYESKDQTIEDPQERFKVTVFNAVMDTAISSLERRFEQLREHHERFGFLYTFKKSLKSELHTYAKDLEIVLTDGDNRDIDGFMLAEELEALKPILPEKLDNDPLSMLQYMAENNRAGDFPNFVTALRILLTVPVTVASGERSFSKLKLIKTFLCSTMLQDRLSNLAILSIENDVAKTLDYHNLICDFAALKARKISF